MTEETKKTPRQPRRNITIRLPEALRHRLETQAQSEGLTMNAYVLNMINEKIKK